MKKRMGIRLRLLLSMTGFLILINIGFWVFYYAAKANLERDLATKLIGVSQLVAGDIRGDFLDTIGPGDEKTRTYRNLHEKLNRVRDAFLLNKVMIVRADRSLLVDADEAIRIGSPVFLLESAAREMGDALEGTTSATVVYRGDDGKLYKSAYSPVRSTTGAVNAVLVVEASAAFLGQLDVFRNVAIIVLVTSIAAVLVLGFLISWSVVNPVLHLVKASEDIKDGRYPEVPPSGSDEVRYLMASFNDMAASIRAKEEKLRELYQAEAERAEEIERQAEYILESIANGILSVDAKGIVRVCNVEACRIFGVREADVVGCHYGDLPVLAPLTGMLKTSLENGEIVRERELELTSARDEHFHISASSSPLEASRDTGIAVTVVVTDQTPLIRLQEQMQRKETLAAIGELAAHVAHEIRNPLGSMKIYMDLLGRTHVSPEKRDAFVDKISSEIARLDSIVTEFLQFSAPSKMTLAEFNLSDVIRDAVTFAQKDDAAGPYSFEGSYRDHDSIPIRADRNQCMQMFLNLIINARDAMPQGGSVVIDVAPADGDGSAAHDVTVTIRDHGVGIRPGDLEEIFKPFFSTKSDGSGLGLALVQRVVENHRGKIDVDSTPGMGTTVRVTLPVRHVAA